MTNYYNKTYIDSNITATLNSHTTSISNLNNTIASTINTTTLSNTLNNYFNSNTVSSLFTGLSGIYVNKTSLSNDYYNTTYITNMISNYYNKSYVDIQLGNVNASLSTINVTLNSVVSDVNNFNSLIPSLVTNNNLTSRLSGYATTTTLTGLTVGNKKH